MRVSPEPLPFLTSYRQTSPDEEDNTVQKTILVTGSTDGIGLETARMLVSLGQHVLLHGRSPSKLEEAEKALSALPCGGRVRSYVADLSLMADVEALAKAVAGKHAGLEVLINMPASSRCPIRSRRTGSIRALPSIRSLPTC